MILCDLPYGTTACKWDTIIPFEPLWEQYKRVIKDNGAVILFGSQPFTSNLLLSNLSMYKYSLVWEKNGNSGDFAMAMNKFLSKHEDILVFSKGTFGNGSKNKMAYFPQGLIECAKERTKTDGGEQSEHRPGRKKRTVTFSSKYTNFPGSVLKFKKETKKYHPTQKPVALFEYLIRTYTNEGETVLDNCIGSGTTALAAINTGRFFIGMEKDEHYFNVAQKRVGEALACGLCGNATAVKER